MANPKDFKLLRSAAYVSLIYGGFLVITYLAFAYFAFWRHEFLPIFPREVRFLDNVSNASSMVANFTAPPAAPGGLRGELDPFSAVFSLQSLGVLLTGVFLLANGVLLLRHLRHKDNLETKKFVISSLLTAEEKTLYDELVKADGEATQKQLSSSTGFSAVKTYRVLKRLEGKKVVKSFPFGMTKKIILNEE